MRPADREIHPAWLSILMRPRATIRVLADQGSLRHVILLAVLGGFAHTVLRSFVRRAGNLFTIRILLVLCAATGVVLGMAGVFLGGLLFRWTGRWFGGRASAREVRTALAWSAVPRVWALLLWVPLLVYFHGDLFRAKSLQMGPHAPGEIVLKVVGVTQLVFGAWSLVICLLGIAEVHRFSLWRAVAAVLSGVSLIGLPLLLLMRYTGLLQF